LRVHHAFQKLTGAVTRATGSLWAFGSAALVIVMWLVTGPIFGFSDTWQLVINTGTTIVTFLMVFVIQHSQNRETKAIQLKLDELLASMAGASNRLIDVEDVSDEELERLNVRFRDLAQRIRKVHGRRKARRTKRAHVAVTERAGAERASSRS
jgi:low affinity Fe/Cu permease